MSPVTPRRIPARHRAVRQRGPRVRRALLVSIAVVAGLFTAVTGSGGSAVAASTSVITMPAGSTLRAGAQLVSPNLQFVLRMRTTGDLVLTAQGQVLWTSDTHVQASRAIMQTDGNLVVYTPRFTPVWSSKTYGHPGAHAEVSASGDLAVRSVTVTYWHSATVNRSLAAGSVLRAGQTLSSTSGQYVLIMQADGNLVLYGSAKPWGSGTYGHPGAWAVLQTDGNLVVYSATNVALWATATVGSGATSVNNADDGSITLTTADPITVFRAPTGSKGAAIVAAAQTQRTKPYCFDGGDLVGPTKGRDAACKKVVGFDCSGLAMYAVYRATGIILPHYSGSQYSQARFFGGVKVARAALLPGDLVFFIGADGNAHSPGHVGIYIGNNMMIDAQQSGVPVGPHTLYNGFVAGVRYWT